MQIILKQEKDKNVQFDSPILWRWSLALVKGSVKSARVEKDGFCEKSKELSLKVWFPRSTYWLPVLVTWTRRINLLSVIREAWIKAIERVAENLQVLDESDLPPGTMQEMEQEMKKAKKKKVKFTHGYPLSNASPYSRRNLIWPPWIRSAGAFRHHAKSCSFQV